MEMFCEECGAPNAAQARFCVSCGAELRSLDVSAEIPVATSTTGETFRVDDFVQGDEEDQFVANSPSSSSHVKTALIAVGALLVGVITTIALREFGTLDFALGEKVPVEAAASQAKASYDSGFSEGEEEGDQQGYTRGYEEGKTAGFSEGDELGYSRGYDEGRDVGFIDGEAGITPTNLGAFDLSVDWTYLSSGRDKGSRGLCVFSSGSSFNYWDSWKWAFISASGEIRFLSDTNGYYNCYAASDWSKIGSLNRYSRLAVYITDNGITDRWGPLPIPQD